MIYHMTLLTLSNSSTIRTTLLTLFTSLPRLNLTVHILESRPRCEGADLASQLLNSLPKSEHLRLHIRIFPDCAVGPALCGVDFALLGADRISSGGDVSNKIGSLGVAVMARREAGARVVVISEVDKIVAGDGGKKSEIEAHEDVEVHPASELTEAWAEEMNTELKEMIHEGTVKVFGEWFEWVPAEYIDAYVTEQGVLGTGDVEEFSRKIEKLGRNILT